MSNGYPRRRQARAVPGAGTAAASEAGAARLTEPGHRRRQVPWYSSGPVTSTCATTSDGSPVTSTRSRVGCDPPVVVGCRREAAAQDRLPGRPATSCSTGSWRSPPRWSHDHGDGRLRGGAGRRARRVRGGPDRRPARRAAGPLPVPGPMVGGQLYAGDGLLAFVGNDAGGRDPGPGGLGPSSRRRIRTGWTWQVSYPAWCRAAAMRGDRLASMRSFTPGARGAVHVR